MGPLKPREKRTRIRVRARLRTEQGWSDVTIANVSSRGLMLQCVAPPGRSTFIEVRHQGICIVGRVVWSQGAQCGIRTQDAVDVAGLVSQRPAPARKPGAERRAAARLAEPRRPSASETAEASVRFARLFDWAAIAIAAGAAALAVSGLAGSVLQAPMGRTAEALAGGGQG